MGQSILMHKCVGTLPFGRLQIPGHWKAWKWNEWCLIIQNITEPEVKQRPMYQATAKTARNHMSDKETNFTFEVGEE
jgi:hypothetical protein